MSDTKWRKFFASIEASDVDIRQAIVKFIDADEPITISGSWTNLLDPPVAVHTANGPVEFRLIEWLEFPATARFARLNNLPHREVAQDIRALEDAIRDSGKYPLRSSADALRILGYTR